jgi:hypothetical protein
VDERYGAQDPRQLHPAARPPRSGGRLRGLGARPCWRGGLHSREAGGPVSRAAAGPAQGSGGMRTLVLRTWLEPGVAPQFRARGVEITPGRGERPVFVTASVDEACRAVRSWLETSQAESMNGNGDGTVTRGA